MRDVLIGSHDNHAPSLPIDTAHRKDVVTALNVRAEHLFVVVKAITALPGQKERRYGLDGELMMGLLEHRADIDRRVDILAAARVLSNGRLPTLCEKIAQLTDGRA